AGELAAGVEDLISKWLALDKGDHELQGFQHFELAIGSVKRFVADANEMTSLPQRFERLLRESQRLRHLVSEPVIANSINPEIASRAEAIHTIPALSEPEALQAWIDD